VNLRDGSDRLTHSLIEFTAKQPPERESGGSVTVYQPDGKKAPLSPIYGKGLSGPWSAMVDGDDHVWISNFSSNAHSIVQICGARPENCPPGNKPGDAISPVGGYVGGGQGFVIFFGLAKPVAGPRIGPAHNP
jgi:hypothetical protein